MLCTQVMNLATRADDLSPPFWQKSNGGKPWLTWSKLAFFLTFMVFNYGFQLAVAGDDTTAPERMISRSEALEDFAFLVKSLEDYHAGLYLYQDAKGWQEKTDAFKENLPKTIKLQDFFLLTGDFVRKIRDGHTKLYRSDKRGAAYLKARTLPIQPLIFENRMFVDQILGDYGDIRGAEIIKINGEPASDILSRLTPFVEIDGYGYERGIRQLERDFGQFYGLYSSYKTTESHLILSTGQGKTIEITLPGLDFGAFKKWRRSFLVEDRLFKLDFLPDNKTAYLDVGIFWNVQGVEFLEFMKNAFVEIKKRNIKTLIVDIRDNSGGADIYGATLAQYLLTKPFRYFDKIEVTDIFEHEEGIATPAEEGKTRVIIGEDTYGIKQPFESKFGGKLIVLINGKTYSTGADFAQTIHHNSDAIFIGTETSGGYFGNTSWDFVKRVLPHSGVQIRIPLGLYYKSGGGDVNGHGIRPHIWVDRTPEGLKANRDRALEKALELAGE